MAQKRVNKPRRLADTRRQARDDALEEQERPEIRKDLRHWFRER